MINLRVEITVRVLECGPSHKALAERRITLESEHPATIGIGPAVQDMLVAAMIEARTEEEDPNV